MRSVATIVLLGGLLGGFAAGQDLPAQPDLRKAAEQRYRQGDAVGALELLDEAAASEQRPEKHAELLVTAAWLRYSVGRRTEAGATLDRLFQAHPDFTLDPGLYDPAFLAMARQAAERTRIHRSEMVAERLALARTRLHESEPEAARRLLTEVLALDLSAAQVAQVRYSLGMAEMQLENTAEARRLFERVAAGTNAAQDPQLTASALTNLAVLSFRGGTIDEAVQLWERAVVLDPGNLAAWINLGTARIELNDLDAADAALHRAARIPTDDERLNTRLATAQEKLTRLRVPVRESPAANQQPPSAASTPPPENAAEKPQFTGPAKPSLDPKQSTSPPAEPRRLLKGISLRKLGIQFVNLNYNKLGLRGALIEEIRKRSPAARGGLHKGDLVLALDGVSVVDDKDFTRQLKKSPHSSTLEIKILRDGDVQQIAVDL